MDRQISNSVKNKRKVKRVTLFSGVGVGLLLLVLGFNFILRPSVSTGDVFIHTVSRGDLRASITASAIIIPEKEEIIASPLQAKIISALFNTGQQVKKGDTLLILDTSQKEIEVDGQKDELQLRKNKVTQLELEYDKQLKDLKMQYEIKKLRVESLSKLVLEKTELLKIGGSTQDEIERTELDYNVAKLELKHLSTLIQNSKQSMEASIREKDLEIAMQSKNIQLNQQILDQAQIVADKDGVITWINDQVGTTVGLGADLVKIANLGSFKAEGKVSEMHSDKLYTGGEVMIVSNQDSIRGTIGIVHPTVEDRSIKFSVILDDKSAAWLRPNLKVDAFVVTAFQKDVLKIKNGSFYKGGKRNAVFVIDGDRANRVTVEFGESNLNEVELREGLQEGQRVITSDMSNYEHMDYINIR